MVWQILKMHFPLFVDFVESLTCFFSSYFSCCYCDVMCWTKLVSISVLTQVELLHIVSCLYCGTMQAVLGGRSRGTSGVTIWGFQNWSLQVRQCKLNSTEIGGSKNIRPIILCTVHASEGQGMVEGASLCENSLFLGYIA